MRVGPYLVDAEHRKEGGQAKSGADSSSQSPIERGRYIVENVAMCEFCHTPRDAHGEPDRGHWLMGSGPIETGVSGS